MHALTYRSIWVADVHLGAHDAKIEFLLDFLRHTESEYLYLVGDIIDFWKLRSGWYWPPINNELVRVVMKKARHGTRVVYCNTGDWVESCTALAEEADGTLKLIHWADESTTLLDERALYADSDHIGRVAAAG